MTASRCPIRSRMHWPRRAPRSAENSIRQEKGAPRQGAPDRLRSDRPGSVAGEGLQPGLGATQDQGMHVVGALVGVDRLEVERSEENTSELQSLMPSRMPYSA